MEQLRTHELPPRFQFATIRYPSEEQLPIVIEHALESLWQDFGVIRRYSPVEYDPPYGSVKYELHIGDGIWFDSFDENEIIAAIDWIRTELVKFN